MGPLTGLHGSREAAGQPDTAPPPWPSQRPAQACAGTPEPTVLAVDATGLLVRCSRAGARRGLHTRNGTPTGTLLMFISSLSRKVRAVRPDYLIAAWDGDGALGWRRSLYPGYKANRAVPAFAGTEMLQAMEFCDAAGICSAMVSSFEADDILAAVQRLFRRQMPTGTLLLCSDDLDMLQLADSRTLVTGLTRDNGITAADVEQSWGIRPSGLSWVRALAGDKSDNIPGIRGVGPAKAVRMIRDGGDRWPLPEHLLPPGGAGLRELVSCWKEIMDLAIPMRSPVGAAGMDHFGLLHQSRWEPETEGKVLEMLGRYELSDLAERLRKGRFW